LTEKTENEFKLVKDTFNNQMIEINDKLLNTKQRLEDCLIEMSRKTVANFETSGDNSSAALMSVEQNLTTSQNDIKNSMIAFEMLSKSKFLATKQSVIQIIRNSDRKNLSYHESIVDKLNRMLELDLTHISSNTDSIFKYNQDEFKNLRNTFTYLDSKMSIFQQDLEKLNQVYYFFDIFLRLVQVLFIEMCEFNKEILKIKAFLKLNLLY
jgi:hypothetical protein